MDRVPKEADWRLQAQELYLTGAQLSWRAWAQHRADWDHDHCEFCWAKFGPAGLAPDSLTEGWSTAGSDRWICKECGTDFAERFGWSFLRDDEVH